MHWRYSYLRLKCRRIMLYYAPHHNSRYRIDITAHSFLGDGVDQKKKYKNWWPWFEAAPICYFLFFGWPPPPTESVLKNQKGKYPRKWNRTILMRPYVLKGIYVERSKWETEILKHQQSTTADERTQRSGLSKGKKNQVGTT